MQICGADLDSLYDQNNLFFSLENVEKTVSYIFDKKLPQLTLVKGIKIENNWSEFDLNRAFWRSAEKRQIEQKFFSN